MVLSVGIGLFLSFVTLLVSARHNTDDDTGTSFLIGTVLFSGMFFCLISGFYYLFFSE